MSGKEVPLVHAYTQRSDSQDQIAQVQSFIEDPEDKHISVRIKPTVRHILSRFSVFVIYSLPTFPVMLIFTIAFAYGWLVHLKNLLQ